MNNTSAFEHSYESVSAPVSQVQPQSTTASPRKRGRQPDQDIDPKIAAKRAKAAERQRRKRERDRRATIGALNNVPQPVPGPSIPVQPPPAPPAEPPQLTKEEEERREKVRAAARERQRKHRAIVKQRKMAELGLAMGENGMMPEEVHYALQPDGQYQPVLPPSAAQPQEMGNPENQYQPTGAQTGGQTFASTLLLSLSCSPLLKAHLLRSLNMSNEELCSLEPILSAAWDQWDHARRLHYAEQAAQAGRQQQQQQQQHGDQQQHPEQQRQQQQSPQQQNGLPLANAAAPPPHPFGPPPISEQHDPNDFRSRFHRPLTAPSPFGTIPMPGAPGQIDPNLNGTASSTAFAEAVAKVAMAANTNGSNVQQGPNGLADGEADAEGGSASEDAEVEIGNAKEEMQVNAVLNDPKDS